MQKIFINDVFNNLKKMANNPNVVKWIIAKCLRLKINQLELLKKVSYEDFARMEKCVERVNSGETLSKIFGYVEFCGEFFEVTNGVFDPRLSTESLVSSVTDQKPSKDMKILDMCTGSGSVAITISKKIDMETYGCDISEDALTIAEINNQNLHAKSKFFKMDLKKEWASQMPFKFDIIVSNPPYWSPEKILSNPEVVKNNPLIAFDGGMEGMDFYKIIIENAPKFLNKGGKLFLEFEEDQLPILNKLLSENFKDNLVTKDYRGFKRVLSTCVKENKFESNKDFFC
ncbi:MAG: HemK/PrmC family methyltransferase [Clostridia bacterium]